MHSIQKQRLHLAGIIFLMLFCNCSIPQKDDILLFFFNDTKVDFPSGISYAELSNEEQQARLHYVIREDFVKKISSRNSGMRINLVRDGKSMLKIIDPGLTARKELKLGESFTLAQPGDALVIELLGGPDGLVKIVTIWIRE